MIFPRSHRFRTEIASKSIVCNIGPHHRPRGESLRSEQLGGIEFFGCVQDGIREFSILKLQQLILQFLERCGIQANSLPAFNFGGILPR